MTKIKRVFSLILAIAMLLGMSVNSSLIAARNEKNEFKESKYKIVNKDGRNYKVYSLKDVSNKSLKSGLVNKGSLNRSKRSLGNQTIYSKGDPLRSIYKVTVNWTVYDLQPNKLGMEPFKFAILDNESEKIIAETNEITGEGVYHFFETEHYDDPDVSKNPFDWQIWLPAGVEFEIRLGNQYNGTFQSHDVSIDVEQYLVPLYKAEYFTNAEEMPKIEAQRNDDNNRKIQLELNNKNIGKNEYNAIIPVETGLYYKGDLITILKGGGIAREALLVSDDIIANRCYTIVKVPGMTDYVDKPRQSGSFTNTDSIPYHYAVTGNHLDAHIVTVRQDLKVKFDPNGGTWKGTAPADQTIGHSMKLADSWAGLGPIAVPAGSTLTPPTAAAGEPENEFKGWCINANGTGTLFTVTAGYTEEIKDNTTFYAIFGPKAQGKVNVKYVDENDTAITDTKYHIAGEKYPAEQEGNINDTVVAKAPKFLGYKLTGTVIDPAQDAKYTNPATATITYKYKKLDDIIPEKNDDGTDNPEATDDVKTYYKKVTIKVDGSKGKFQKNSADVTGTEFVYYVNPVEGKTLDDVKTASGLTPISNDENVNKIDTTKPWTFNPSKTAEQTPADVALTTEVNKTNFTGDVVMEVNFKQTKADQLKDKLDPVDIKVWVDDIITWKEGVELNAANKDNETLKSLLAEATVTDLGPNGTITAPGTARNSSKQNLPDGKKGNLKVAFDDGSTLVVENQMLYVADQKVPVKPGEENQIDPDKLPSDKVAVKFLLGEGVKIGTKKGNATTPVLYQTIYVKPTTSLEDSDIPATELQENYKDNKWYNVNTELAAADYTNITAAKEFIAKAVLKGQGTVNVEYWADGVKIDDITEYKLPNKTYITSKPGAEDAEVKANEFTNDYFDLIGYEKDTTKGTDGIEVPANAVYLTSNPATVKFHYKKIDDIIGPVQPGDKKPAGYVTVIFKSDDNQASPRGQLYLGTDETKLYKELVYYVNPKANTIDLDSNKLSGKDKDNGDINIVVNAKPENKYEVLKKQGGAYDWIISDSKAIDNGKVTKDLTLTVQYDGLYRLRYVYESSKAGKDLPAEIAQPIAPAKPEKLSEIPQTLADPDMKSLVVKDGNKVKGVWYFDKWVRTVDETKQEVTFTGYWKYFEPIPKDITVQVGETPKAKDGIKNPKDAPKDTDYKFKEPIDTKTPGDKNATVIVTIKTPTKDDPNKTTVIEVPIVVHVTDLRCITPAPEINPVYDSDEYITGRGIAGAVIEVRYRDYPILRTKVDTFGEWEVYTPYPLEDEQFVYARQIKEPCDPSVWVSEEIRYDDEYWRKDDKKEEPKKPVEIKKVWTPTELNARDHFSYIKGYGDNTFGPNRTITRAEVAMIFARLSINQSVSGAPQFTDVKPGDWYRRAVDIVARQGVVKGYEDGTFRPNQPITRREFAAIAARYAGNIDTWRTFRDVPATDWAYTLINRVGGAGWITGYEDNTFRPNNLITRAEVVAIVNRMLNRKADKAYVDNNLMRSKHSFIDNLRSAWYFYDVHEAAVGHAFERQPNGVDEKWNRVTGQAFEIGKDVMYR